MEQESCGEGRGGETERVEEEEKKGEEKRVVWGRSLSHRDTHSDT